MHDRACFSHFDREFREKPDDSLKLLPREKMVKLTVAPPELHAKETVKKLPPVPGSAVEIPLEKESDVYVARRPFCTKGTICSLLTCLAILAVGGALLGLYLSHAHRAPRCYDWGPNCEMKGPPVPPAEHYNDEPGMEPQSGGNSHEMPGSHGRHHGSHHGGSGGHYPDGDRHRGHSSSSSSEEHGSGHDRHHERPEDHPEERPNHPPEAPTPDYF